MSNYTKKQLIDKISKDLRLHPVDVRKTVDAFFDAIVDGLLEGKRFEFRRFGVFSLVTKKKKIGRNPKQADRAVVIPEHQTVKFKVSTHVKKRIEK